MSAYNLNISLETIKNITVMFLDIFIIWLILYYALRIIRNNARTVQIFKGIMVVVVIDGLAKILGLKTLQYLADMFINWGLLAIIIIFQPEIRSLLEKMGKSNVFSRITTLTGNERESLVDNIVTAVMLLSKDQTGALISIEQGHSLEDFIQTGTRLNSDVTAELLTSIFVTSTPLHDGAVIIQGDKIACASAYFPPTNMELPSRYGARHRAAIGISEITDAVTIVVSEETGNVSIAEAGKLIVVDREELRNYLLRVICGENTEVRSGSARETYGSVVIDDKAESGREKKGMFSKLAVRKQDSNVSPIVEKKEESSEEAAAAAELAAANETAVEEEVLEIRPALSTAEIHRQADQEAEKAEIKLPHKKKRVKPSYPEQHKRKLPAAYEEKSSSSAQKRMTPEEVRAAREASVNRLRTARNAAETKPADEKLDTSRIDVSRVVGFDGELNRQFDMIDQLADTSAHQVITDEEGGERQ